MAQIGVWWWDSFTDLSLVMGFVLRSKRNDTWIGWVFFFFFFFFKIRFGWGSLLRWVCVGSGWVYCFRFVVDSWWFYGRFWWICGCDLRAVIGQERKFCVLICVLEFFDLGWSSCFHHVLLLEFFFFSSN